ncbi:hypothetical protein PSECIP111951_03458 [Pseudoalteromonas holothuriae]|uniref:Uncharacterized protein n=1 Tax=Pseudoalteromonas holothuriae TaxID=2963714 RepID=A0A9W4R430_9GAMM|nr:MULTISPECIES: hypothetical protein [unclassified Pseudoalteromonas]CAH9065883.1 hypothetical protein PSECIP111951_03458 [Pseudoalteromonas sp. CIP111951]CAH9066257.1 hypothetical protein PSECIP111854_03851 [Pseudoalteromonas sp. CIP111854]
MFVAHGLWRVFMDPPCAYISMKGAFNKEGIIAFQNDLMATASQFAPQSMMDAVVDLTEFEMSTADSIEDTRQYFAGVTQRGLQTVSYVGANALARHMLEQLWQDTTTAVHFFTSMEELVSNQPHYKGNIDRLVKISFKHPN